MFSFLSKLFGPGVDYKTLVQEGALILDVRTPEEFKQGHIKSSKNIPLQVISGRMAELKKQNKVIIAVCRSGARSGAAVRMMRAAGIDAHNGGAWNALQSKI
ncbi:MAG: rhodanese-like domain-containing protein [Saprospiraceae bacterium]|jgi:rhodanese-related sulfurtransferase